MDDSSEVYRNMFNTGMEVFIKYAYDAPLDYSYITVYKEISDTDQLTLILNGWLLDSNTEQQWKWVFSPPNLND